MRIRLLGLLAATALGVFTSLAPGADPAAFRFAGIDKDSLGLWEGDRPVLVYNHGIKKKEGVPDDRRRSSYVHPLYGLDGEVLTDDFPKDHYHHRGLFWGWPHVRIGGKEYDLWALRGIRHEFERWTERKAEGTAAVLGVENGWYVGERRVVREQARLRVAPATASGRTIDVELRWTALDAPVTLWGAKGKSYGGLSLRFAPRRKTAITTPDGRQESDLNLVKLPWADLTGQFEGARGPSGVTILLPRDHPGYPPTWITRSYGFLGVGWPGVEPVELRPGQAVTCKYRIWVHRGSLDVGQMRKMYEAYLLNKPR